MEDISGRNEHGDSVFPVMSTHLKNINVSTDEAILFTQWQAAVKLLPFSVISSLFKSKAFWIVNTWILETEYLSPCLPL